MESDDEFKSAMEGLTTPVCGIYSRINVHVGNEIESYTHAMILNLR